MEFQTRYDEDNYFSIEVFHMQGEKLGTFKVVSPTLVVSDPCYPIEVLESEGGHVEPDELSLVLNSVMQGEWKAIIYYTEDDEVAKLVALHTNANESGEWTQTEKDIGVDSGQAGIFDSSFYGRDEKITYEVENVFDIPMEAEGMKFYVACSDLTNTEEQGGVMGGGVI